MTATYKTPLLIIGGLFIIWGILGLIDARNVPYAGYLTDPSNSVIRVDDGSPAEAAGLSIGDRVMSIDGVSIEDTPALTRMPRARIGETRTLVVESAEGAVEGTREVAITYAGQPGKNVALTWAAFVIGLCFIGFGLLAYMKAPGRSSLLLAVTGLCLGVAFLGGPYIESYALRTIVGTVQLVIAVLGFATLLHCLLEFPRVKKVLAKNYMVKVIYAPAVVLVLFLLWLIIFEPAGTSTLNNVVNALVSIFIAGYFGLALVALLHSFVTATAAERSQFGLNLLLVGLLIGLVPLTVAALVGTFAPSVLLPGSDFFFLSMVFIPITLAMAIMKASRVGAAEATPPLM